MSVIDLIHAVVLSAGNPIVNALVLMNHPRKMIDSFCPPSASSLRRDAIGGRRIGSLFPAFGRQIKCSESRLQRRARSTISLLSSVASTAVAQSSMYPSHPPFVFDGRSTSACRAWPYGSSFGWSILVGTCSCIGGFSSSVFHSLQSIRSSARSNVVSEYCENSVGPGDEPKGSLFSIDPTSVSDFSISSSFSFVLWRYQVAQHLDDILGCVCNLLYALSMSFFAHRIGSFGLWKRMQCILCRKRWIACP